MFPLSTGEAAKLLSVPEPRLSDLVRRGKIVPPPSIVAGRRVWQEIHLRQAAAILGTPAAESERLLEPATNLPAGTGSSRGEPGR